MEVVTSTDGDNERGFQYKSSGNQVIAQSVTIGSTGFNLCAVEPMVRENSATSGDILIDICADNTDKPGTILATVTIPASATTSTHQYIKGYLSSALALSANTKYWFMYSSNTSGDTNFLKIDYTTPTYTGGTLKESTDNLVT